jgi:hypothetical protein
VEVGYVFVLQFKNAVNSLFRHNQNNFLFGTSQKAVILILSPPQEPEIPRLHLVQAYAHEIVVEVLASDLGRFTGSGLFVFLRPSKMS